MFSVRTASRYNRRMEIADSRREYPGQPLDESSAGDDPVALFRAWLRDAMGADQADPTAMTLATVGPDGQPAARTVLLKGFDEQGFVFYSHYASKKGRQLAANPRAALLFYWDALLRQVQVQGSVTKLSAPQSRAYFATRPRESQVSAAASPQSQVIASRRALDEACRLLEQQIGAGDVSMPDDWGGYRLAPRSIEFWQGRPNRLHDRLCYTLLDTGRWRRRRLAP